MSPTLQLSGSSGLYTPLSDILERHEYGITKNRKPASTGGGRAWSEDEEAYLLQTRLQKMPYKHIAAHLKKTELACRLHFHQLSHGSNRRKRTTSMSSGSSTGGHSPTLGLSNMPSPIHEQDVRSPSRSLSPVTPVYGSDSPIQLPAILSTMGSSHGSTSSPRLPAILPKHHSMTLALSTSISSGSVASPTSFPTPVSESHPHSAPLHLQSGFPLGTPTTSSIPAPLRLECSAFPPPPPGLSSAGLVLPSGVDMGRLGAAYAAHRATFWAAIAADYGPGVNPLVLEQAWRGGYAHSTSSSSSNGLATFTSAYHNSQNQASTPLTPVASPESSMPSSHCEGYSSLRGLGLNLGLSMGLGMAMSGVGGLTSGRQMQNEQYQGQDKGQQQQAGDKTRISSLLGIDANPRSPKERELVRRMEEERVTVVAASA